MAFKLNDYILLHLCVCVNIQSVVMVRLIVLIRSIEFDSHQNY